MYMVGGWRLASLLIRTQYLYAVCPVVSRAFAILRLLQSGTNPSRANVEQKLEKERLFLWRNYVCLITLYV